VELAIVLPLALLLLSASIDVGRILFTYIALEDAVHEGAVFMAHNPATPGANPGTTAIVSRVRGSSDAPEVSGATVVTSCSTAQVSVQASAPSLQMITPAGSQIFGAVVLTSKLFATNLKGACP
jgi:hypothetical protein